MDQKQVLIIEDSPTQARYTSLVLESEGYRTCTAGTGQEGLDMAARNLPDLILLDVILPDIDGFSVCTQLRERLGSYIPILMFTDQRIAVEDKVDGVTAGADDYMSKSFDPRELLARVKALLRVKQMVDEMLARMANEHQAYQALRRIALTDHVTGLYNRHYFAEALEREFQMAFRYNLPLACIMCDIDHFRNFNNNYGHATGDWVLRGAAGLMKDNLRQTDIIARYGGEEFVILLTMTDLNEAVNLADRLRYLVEHQTWKSPAGDLYITISYGVAAIPNPAIVQMEQLLEFSDQALYLAKSRGRNRVEVFDEKMGPGGEI